jgi:hypothetical protein
LHELAVFTGRRAGAFRLLSSAMDRTSTTTRAEGQRFRIYIKWSIDTSFYIWYKYARRKADND